MSGTVSLEFRLYDSSSNGTLLAGPYGPVSVSAYGGIVSAKFGPVAASLFDGSPRWLEPSVNSLPLTRIEMVTAPGSAEQIVRADTGVAVLATDQDGTARHAFEETAGHDA